MIRIDVSGLDVVQRAIRQAADQVPFALREALNTTAFKARETGQTAMRSVFDKPTPWLVRQPRVQKATKETLTAVLASPDALQGRPGVFDRVVAPHITGYKRLARPAENQMRMKGWMPSGYVAYPSREMRLNQYGNISLASWKKLLTLDRDKKLFVAKPGESKTQHLVPGIYERYGPKARNIKPLVFFTSMARYQKRLRWREEIEAAVARDFPPAFEAAFQRALATRR